MAIPCWDSNPRTLERESPPITPRPGLPATEVELGFEWTGYITSLSLPLMN